MKRKVFLKASICLVAIALLLFSATGLCMAGGLLEDTPLGDALDKVEELGSEIVDILTPDAPTETAGGTAASGEADAGAATSEAGSALTGSLDPSTVPGLDALTGALDPSAVPGLDALTGALDPSAVPGLDALPGMEGLPGLPGLPAMDPTQVLQIIDETNQLSVVLTLDDLLKATVGLGKNLEKAPLLELQLILFNALAVEGSLGMEKVDENAFLVPIELYLKYLAGDEGWKEILDVVLPLELSFPGAGMVPDGLQTVIDSIYKFILKPILSLLPIYRDVEPELENPGETKTVEQQVPSTEVLGEVIGEGTGGSGDHLPFTGADLTVVLALIMFLSIAGMLLHGLEKKLGRKSGS